MGKEPEYGIVNNQDGTHAVTINKVVVCTGLNLVEAGKVLEVLMSKEEPANEHNNDPMQ